MGYPAHKIENYFNYLEAIIRLSVKSTYGAALEQP